MVEKKVEKQALMPTIGFQEFRTHAHLEMTTYPMVVRKMEVVFGNTQREVKGGLLKRYNEI